jgi:hypothetical protein
MIGLVKKSELPQLSFERLVEFLDAFSPYSRKTLGKIAKMREKHRSTAVPDATNTSFIIPERLTGKRLEELDWTEIEEILK